MTTRVIQCLDDDAQWQDIPVPFSDDLWKRIKDLKDRGTPTVLRVVERETTETVIKLNAAAEAYQRHAETIEALDSGDEE